MSIKFVYKSVKLFMNYYVAAHAIPSRITLEKILDRRFVVEIAGFVRAAFPATAEHANRSHFVLGDVPFPQVTYPPQMRTRRGQPDYGFGA